MSEKQTNASPKEPQPGDGLRSLRTTSLFRAVNFELYAKPNMAIMAIGITAFVGCSIYIAYMRSQWHDRGYYSTVNPEGIETFVKKKSRWD